jgi:hypothetical protein
MWPWIAVASVFWNCRVAAFAAALDAAALPRLAARERAEAAAASRSGAVRRAEDFLLGFVTAGPCR